MYDSFERVWARTESQAKYDMNNTRNVHLKLNIKTDKDILIWLKKQQSKQGSIKKLIREEISRTSQENA